MTDQSCNFPPSVCPALTEIRVTQGRAEERLDNLETWQTAQNGHLARIDARLDKFLWFLLLILSCSAGTLLLALLARIGGS